MPELMSDREAAPPVARVLVDEDDAVAAVLIHEQAALERIRGELSDLYDVESFA